MTDTIPPHIQRFLLTSIASVPHLEAILLMHQSPGEWTASVVAQRLFISEKKSTEILNELCEAGFLYCNREDAYVYGPTSAQLREIVDEINQIYPRHVVAISRFIHAKTDKQAQTFGDAFKFRKEQ